MWNCSRNGLSRVLSLKIQMAILNAGDFMAKKVSLVLLVFIVGYVIGFIVHLHVYPRNEFMQFYEKIARDGGMDRWVHRRCLSDHTFTDFVRPNNDTLYSYCVVDLAAGPVMIETPAFDRYWCVQFIQENTDVFYYLSSRINGLNRPVRMVLAPKDFSGAPKGLEVVRAPTRKVWLFCRILVNGDRDVTAVNRLQDRLKCTRLGLPVVMRGGKV